MNILSMLSIIIYTCFFIGAVRIASSGRKSVLNISACAVLLTLGWWSFCNSFFFLSITIEKAWFWHRLSSIGWCGFVAATAYYFFALTNHGKWKPALWKQVLFFVPTFILILGNLFSGTTSLAQGIVMSEAGSAITYSNSIDSILLWVYLLYVVLYFAIAFSRLYRWEKSSKHKMKKKMAIEFIILDLITIMCGVITDVIFPIININIPALASLGTAIFAIGYFGIIYRYDVFNIDVVISSDDILKTSNNPIFVMDENKEILKYNTSAGDLLGYSRSELIGRNFMEMSLNPINFSSFSSSDDLVNIESKMLCKDGKVKDVLLSASVAEDKRHNFICMIVSCHDITKQKKIQNQLELEQENYKMLVGDYQKLANYDSLTGLPNRRYFYEVLNDFEKLYITEKKDFAVLFLDVDNFKIINDLYGHKAGDKLLSAVAEKLSLCVQKEDFIARLGGDEFIIIMFCHCKECIEQRLERIKNEFKKSTLLNGEKYQIELSAGYGVFSEIGDVTKLMQIADEDMYINKQNKKAVNSNN